MSQTESLPGLQLEIDGRRLGELDAPTLASVWVNQRLSLPTQCELLFIEPSEPVAGANRFLPGTTVRVAVTDREEPLFVGEITAIEHTYGPSRQHQVRVRAYDPMHRLRKAQTIRPFVDLTVAELAEELLRGSGLSVRCETAGPAWQKIVQWRQSDLELLTETAQSCGLYFTVRDDVVHFLTLEGDGEAVPLRVGESLIEAQIVANTDPACRSVRSLGWNPWLAESRRGEAGSARVGRRIDFDAGPAAVGASGERTLVNAALQSDEQAEWLAQAELDGRVAGEVTLSGVAAGDPRLQPGRTVRLSGVAPPLNGVYVLTSVSHSIDRRQGFRSEIDTAPPVPEKRQRGAISTFGIVTSVDDPDRLGRVTVRLPGFDDIETDWLEVLTPGAGQDKGLIAMPDVEDRVLVIFCGDDPAQGIVLGGLYGAGGLPDDGIVDAQTRRYTLVTRDGQRLCLDGERDLVRLENSGGNYLQVSPGRARVANSDGSFIEMTRDLVKLHASRDLELEAPGKTIVIRGASIEFETG